VQQRRIGDVSVSAIGLGGMQLSLGDRMPPERDAIRTVHAALDAGVTLIDTADAYAPDSDSVGHNERLIAKALRAWSGDASAVLVATKGGHTRTPGGGWGTDARPEYLRQACEASLRALGVEAIGLYQFHRPDPAIPTGEAVATLAELKAEGKIRMVGVSNFNPAQIEEAATITELVAVQNEFSPRFRSSLPELELCAERGIAFLPWSPLGGMSSAAELGSRHAPFAEVARERGVSPQQVALAWQLALAPVVIPIPGASRPETILDSVGAVDLELSDEELSRLNAAEAVTAAV
jgi:aryl-alcohol dehydrogenase-like predicted oxidoreductase